MDSVAFNMNVSERILLHVSADVKIFCLMDLPIAGSVAKDHPMFLNCVRCANEPREALINSVF